MANAVSGRVRPWGWAAAFWLGLILLPFCVVRGTQYFLNALDYSKGLNAMDVAYELADKRPDFEKQLQLLSTAAEKFNNGHNAYNISAYYKLGSVLKTISDLYRNRMEEQEKAGHHKEAGHSEELADHYTKESLRTYQKLNRLWPDYAEIDFNLAIVEEAQAKVLERKAGQESNPAKLKAEAEHYKKLAVEHINRMNRFSTKEEVAVWAGNMNLEMKNFAKALEIFKVASNRYPNNRDLAERYLDAANRAHAAKDLQSAQQRLDQFKNSPSPSPSPSPFSSRIPHPSANISHSSPKLSPTPVHP
jgi:tetratricopeptide (TPR) repeat protein